MFDLYINKVNTNQIIVCPTTPVNKNEEEKKHFLSCLTFISKVNTNQINGCPKQNENKSFYIV